MPAYQTAYAGTLSPGYEGMVANMEVTNIISRTIETAGGIGFGKPAYQGAADQSIAATGSILRGVTVVDKNVRPSGYAPNLAYAAAAGDAYAQGDTVSVATRGDVWVTVSGAVTAGAAAYLTPGQAWSATASGNTAVPGAMFDSSASNGGLAKLRFSLV
jgi:hypothetical protein